MHDISTDNLPMLVPREQIAEAVGRLAGQISRDYRDKTPLLVGVLKGSFIFMADLVRALDIPMEVEFVRLSSYGSRTRSSGVVKVINPLRGSIRGRHVLVVEDIVDSGLTLSFLLEYLQRKGPASVRLCTLLVKGSPEDFSFPIDYYGLQVPRVFVVGYGIDAREQYRQLADIREYARGLG